MLRPRELQERYQRGENISALLRDDAHVSANTEEIIEVAYDLQTGSYIDALKHPGASEQKEAFAEEIAEQLLGCGQPASVPEAVGEATTLAAVDRHLDISDLALFGFDLSWSRVACGRRWLQAQGRSATLCTGSLFHIPFADHSIDVVYTSHAVESNGGQERAIVAELLRVTGKLLVLVEPGYELASPQAQERMRKHGYCRNLRETAEAVGGRVLEHRLLKHSVNPLNPSAFTVVEPRPSTGASPRHRLACPRFGTPLLDYGDVLYSPEALVAYPVVLGIPCLRREQGILASKLPEYGRVNAEEE